MGYVKKEYIQSDTVTQLEDAYRKQTNSRPGAYTSRNQQQMDTVLGKIQGRENFRYNLEEDALYRQYRDQYVRQGRLAMMDTMGQAAAMTGGYGNSYAQTAGQQTYQGYLQSLNSQIPELYALALEKYQMEGDALLSEYQVLAQQDQTEYQQYRDTVSDWEEENQRLYQQYWNEREFDYGNYRDEENFAYEKYRDEKAEQQWQSSFDYQQQQDMLAYERWLQEFEYQKQQDDLAYEQWRIEFEENKRRYDQSRTGSSSGSASGRSSGSKTSAEDSATAHRFVENMLNNATGSRFDPERVIDGTNALTESQKKEAKRYLDTVLDAGRMK